MVNKPQQSIKQTNKQVQYAVTFIAVMLHWLVSWISPNLMVDVGLLQIIISLEQVWGEEYDIILLFMLVVSATV